MQEFKLENITESSEEFAKKMLERLSKSYSYDFSQFFSDDVNLSTQEIKKRFTLKLLERRLDIYDQKNVEDEDYDETDTKTVLAKVSNYFNGNENDLEPNIAINKLNYNIIKGYTGNNIKQYVYTLAKRFENMQNAKSPGELAAELIGSALIGVGASLIYETIKAFNAGLELLEAIKSAIKKLGMKQVIVTLVLVLTELLVYLLVKKSEKILGIIFNDTDHNWVVNNWNGKEKTASDLYMDAGGMMNFPVDYLHGDLSKPRQIIQRIADKNPEEYIIYGGIYFANRHIGFLGSEGIMVLTSDKNSSMKIAHQFSVPFSEDNGTVIEQISGSYNIKSLFNDMVKRRKEKFESSATNFDLQAAVSNVKGGEVGLIATINQK